MIPMPLLQTQEKYEKVPSVFIETAKARARPKKLYSLRITNKRDVKTARKSQIPIMRITSQEMSIFNYPMTMPMQLIVPREYKAMIESDYKVNTFESMEPFKKSVVPRVEDLIIFMMKFDLIAATALFERNKDLIDLDYLRKRSFQENTEKELEKVLSPRPALARAAAKNTIRMVLP